MAYSTVAVTPGVGAGIAVDAIAGSQYQRIKMGWGPQGTVNEVDTPTPIPAIVLEAISKTQGLTWLKIDSAAGGNLDLVAGVALQFVRIYAFFATLASPTTIQLADTTPTTVTGAMTFGFGGGPFWDLQVGPNGLEPYVVSAIGKGFRVVMGAAVQISGFFAYQQGV